MSCIPLSGGGFVCVSPHHRLRLDDGRYIYMGWHRMCGPMFTRDRNEQREIVDWYDDPLICKALDWFLDRGHRS